MTHIARAGLSVATPLAAFLEDEVLPGLGIDPREFWAGAADMFARFTPQNRALLEKRCLLYTSDAADE